MVRQGAIDSPPKCPFILGFECAGEIEQVGEGVEGFAVSIMLILVQKLYNMEEIWILTYVLEKMYVISSCSRSQRNDIMFKTSYSQLGSPNSCY